MGSAWVVLATLAVRDVLALASKLLGTLKMAPEACGSCCNTAVHTQWQAAAAAEVASGAVDEVDKLLRVSPACDRPCAAPSVLHTGTAKVQS